MLQEMRERFDLDMPATCKAVSHHPLPPAVLVVHGDADPICESSDAAALADNIASAQLCVISGANHWFTGCFEPLTAAIKGFTVRHWLEQGIGTCNPATNFVQR
jgi:alpha/beta superfamily hydrolase